MATVLMTATGRAITTARLKGLGTEPKWLHWGTDDGTILPLADSNEALGAPGDEDRVEGTSSQQTSDGGTTNDTYRVVGTLTAEGDIGVQEAALFDEAGAGDPPVGDNLYIRGVFDAINLGEGDSIQFTIDGVYEPPA